MHTCRVNVHEEGLQDDCARCAEHAEHPFRGLDERMLADLIDRTLRNRFGGIGAEADSAFGLYCDARSETEAMAMAQVMTTLERVGCLAAAAPGDFALYLGERWHLDAEIQPRGRVRA